MNHAEVDRLTLLYRGPLDSCNYACGYCPFAKRPETSAQAEQDAAALARFVEWCRQAPVRQLSVFFTPWGEALYHDRYRRAIITLSQLPHLERVAIQTNLAGSLDWLAEADPARVGVWATWHPSEAKLAAFVRRVQQLTDLGISHSVGVVGVRSRLDDFDQLRAALPSTTPLWVNAYSHRGGAVRPDYYSAEEVARLRQLDPFFEVGLVRFASRGRGCAAGREALAVDGAGQVRRCHFLDRVRGNLYTDPLAELLSPAPCPRPVCDCHIGYVQLDDLRAAGVYGDGLLHRVPRPELTAKDIEAYLSQAASLDLGRR